jgi:O-antigen/teichoic acid export membrane protein
MIETITKPIVFFKSLITRGHDRSVGIKKNILGLFVLRGCSIAISFILVPLTIHYINPTRYGIWLTLSSIVGWLSFFDIGFGNGLRNRFAEAIAKGEDQLARIYISTTYAILSIIVFVLLLLFLCINPFINWTRILNAPASMGRELGILALIVFVFFCLQFVLQLITTVITANQRPAKASVFNFLGSVFSLIVIFILTKTTSGNLIYLGIALGFTPVLVFVASSAWFYTHEYKKYAPSAKYVKFGYARNLMSLGIKFFFVQIAAIVLYQTDNIIIAQLFGPSQVTPYNIVYKYFGAITMVLSIVIMPLWSAFTEAWVKKDIEWIKSTMKKLRIWWMVMSFFTVIMLVFSNFVYRVWVGSEIKIPFAISLVMAAYVIIYAWNGIYTQFLNGVGKIKLQLYSGIWGIVLNIPMAIFLSKLMGISGVVLSIVILAAINMIWEPIQVKKILNNTAKGIWDK